MRKLAFSAMAAMMLMSSVALADCQWYDLPCWMKGGNQLTVFPYANGQISSCTELSQGGYTCVIPSSWQNACSSDTYENPKPCWCIYQTSPMGIPSDYADSSRYNYSMTLTGSHGTYTGRGFIDSNTAAGTGCTLVCGDFSQSCNFFTPQGGRNLDCSFIDHYSGYGPEYCWNLYGTISGTFEAKPKQPTCVSNWQCTSWSACISGHQSRTCNDVNNCGKNDGPGITQTCTISPPPNPEPSPTFFSDALDWLLSLWESFWDAFLGI